MVVLCALVLASVPPELQQVADAMQSVQSLRVQMRQTKEMQVFGEPMIATGSLIFVRPRRLRMDLRGDGGSTLIIDGDTLTLHHVDLNRTEHLSLGRDARARAVAEHLFLLLEAKPEALASVYEVNVTTRSPLQARLVPKAEALRRIIAYVDARFDDRGFVDLLVMNETNGDATRWEFTAPQINTAVADSTFRLQP